MRSKLWLASIPCVFLAASSIFAQDNVVNVETNLVTMNIAVTDRSGKHIVGLKREDFSILDNLGKQSIDTFSAEQAPVSFGIVYDLHPTTDEKTAIVLGALELFVKDLRSEDSYFVSVFNEKGSLTTEFVPRREQLDKFLSENDPGSPNSLYDAIFHASTKIQAAPNVKKVLLVLTDGADHSSHHSLKDLRQHLRSLNLPVYSMTFTNGDRRQFGYSDLHRGGPRQTLGSFEFEAINKGAINEITRSSGGQAFEDSIRNRYYLASLMGKVYGEVKNQYVIGFYPDAQDGKWHRLKVSVADQKARKLRVSSRKGYMSPKAGK